MKITIDLDAEVNGKLPYVHDIRNMIDYGLRKASDQLRHIGVEITSVDIYIDPEE